MVVIFNESMIRRKKKKQNTWNPVILLQSVVMTPFISQVKMENIGKSWWGIFVDGFMIYVIRRDTNHINLLLMFGIQIFYKCNIFYLDLDSLY